MTFSLNQIKQAFTQAIVNIFLQSEVPAEDKLTSEAIFSELKNKKGEEYVGYLTDLATQVVEKNGEANHRSDRKNHLYLMLTIIDSINQFKKAPYSGIKQTAETFVDDLANALIAFKQLLEDKKTHTVTFKGDEYELTTLLKNGWADMVSSMSLSTTGQILDNAFFKPLEGSPALTGNEEKVEAEEDKTPEVALLMTDGEKDVDQTIKVKCQAAVSDGSTEIKSIALSNKVFMFSALWAQRRNENEALSNQLSFTLMQLAALGRKYQALEAQIKQLQQENRALKKGAKNKPLDRVRNALRKEKIDGELTRSEIMVRLKTQAGDDDDRARLRNKVSVLSVEKLRLEQQLATLKKEVAAQTAALTRALESNDLLRGQLLSVCVDTGNAIPRPQTPALPERYPDSLGLSSDDGSDSDDNYADIEYKPLHSYDTPTNTPQNSPSSPRRTLSAFEHAAKMRALGPANDGNNSRVYGSNRYVLWQPPRKEEQAENDYGFAFSGMLPSS